MFVFMSVVVAVLGSIGYDFESCFFPRCFPVFYFHSCDYISCYVIDA